MVVVIILELILFLTRRSIMLTRTRRRRRGKGRKRKRRRRRLGRRSHFFRPKNTWRAISTYPTLYAKWILFFPEKRGYTKFYVQGGWVEDNESLIKVLNRTMRKKIGDVVRLVKELVNKKCSSTLTPREFEPQSTYQRTAC